MKLLIDINIILDLLLAREPWAEEAALLLSAVEAGRAQGFAAGHSVTTVHYIVAREADRRVASQRVGDLLRIVDIVPLDRHDFAQALLLEMKAFVDAVQAIAALKIGADYIVTRNSRDYRSVEIPGASAGAVLAALEEPK